MYCKTFALLMAVLYAAAALPQHDSHSARAHSVVHPVHEHEHHGSHHAEQHAPAVSSQSVFIHHSGGEHGSGHGDGGHGDGGHGDRSHSGGGHDGHEEEHYGHAKYEFEYKVEDPHTGDNKYQKESRDGDKVEGLYHLVEADGRLRTVKYHADKHSGFNAEVVHSGHAIRAEEPKRQHHLYN